MGITELVHVTHFDWLMSGGCKTFWSSDNMIILLAAQQNYIG